MDPWNTTLERLDAEGLRRELRPGGAGTEVTRDGRQLLNLASNDYLGLATDPRVASAAMEAAERFGVGATASRLITGNLGPHEALEADIASSRGTEAALVFASGYAANVGALQAIAGRSDVVFADALSHASLLDGVRLSGAKLVRFRHGDLDQLRRLLKDTPTSGQRFVVTEGVFSMDGDVANLPALLEVATASRATLIVDDAHGGGILGSRGQGTIAACGLQDAVPIQVGTLSKAIGCQGGYVAGSRALIDLLVNRARPFVFSTGLSPMIAAAARRALAISQEEDWRRETLRRHTAALRMAASAAGFEVRGDIRAPMVLAMTGDPQSTLRASERLAAAGVLAPAIRPPTVPAGTGRIRLSPMATQTTEQIGRATRAFTRTQS